MFLCCCSGFTFVDALCSEAQIFGDVCSEVNVKGELFSEFEDLVDVLSEATSCEAWCKEVKVSGVLYREVEILLGVVHCEVRALPELHKEDKLLEYFYRSMHYTACTVRSRSATCCAVSPR